MVYYAYIMASRPNGTLYIGMTNDLVRRVYEHKEGLADGFTKRYGVKTLVYYEIHETAEQAIRREKTLKRWLCDWKIALIENDSPYWDDLYQHLWSRTMDGWVKPEHDGKGWGGGVAAVGIGRCAHIVMLGLDPSIHDRDMLYRETPPIPPLRRSRPPPWRRRT